jgi:hypothetical protein
MINSYIPFCLLRITRPTQVVASSVPTNLSNERGKTNVKEEVENQNTKWYCSALSSDNSLYDNISSIA